MLTEQRLACWPVQQRHMLDTATVEMKAWGRVRCCWPSIPLPPAATPRTTGRLHSTAARR